jgi:outer membrane usher protein FimD/PapC
VRAAQYGGKTQLSGDYRKDYDDSFGTTTAGVTVNRIDSTNSFNAYGSRSGTRGDASLNVGHSDAASNVDFNYRGMFAANEEGIALGRYSNGGSAILLRAVAPMPCHWVNTPMCPLLGLPVTARTWT